MPLTGAVRERRQCLSMASEVEVVHLSGSGSEASGSWTGSQAAGNSDGTFSQGRLILELGGGPWGVYNDRCCFIVGMALLCCRFIFQRWRQAGRRMRGLRGIWDSDDGSVEDKGTSHTLVAAGNRRNPVLSGSVPGTWLGRFFAGPRMSMVGIGVTYSDYHVQE